MKNMINKIFGRWTVISLSHKVKYTKYWLCRCECGETRTVSESHLKSGGSKSCGCLKRELSYKLLKTHGKSKTTEYIIWKSMRQRCLNSNNPRNKFYKQKGIKLCDRWLASFENFYEDMGERPSSKHSVGRINNDGNYEPSNCRWETAEEQQNNTSRNHYIDYNGQIITMKQISNIYKISYYVLRSRLRYGWGIKEAIETPVGKRS